ncbi:MAG: cysteine hydrolase family protein [Thermoleophilia bacterium]
MTPAVIIVDMLDDFVTGQLANPRSARIIPVIAELADAARRRGWPVVYANDAHLPGDFEERVWGPHALAGTPGAQVIPELSPRPGDLELPKRFYSSFYETGLDAFLRQNGVDTVILAGQHTNICVRHTAADALYRGYRIVVPPDAVEAFTQEDHDSGLAYLDMAYKAELTPVAELLGAVAADR